MTSEILQPCIDCGVFPVVYSEDHDEIEEDLFCKCRNCRKCECVSGGFHETIGEQIKELKSKWNKANER